MGLAATRESLTSYVVEFLPGFIHGISLVQDWGFEMTGRIYGLEILLGSCAVNGLFLGFGYEPSKAIMWVRSDLLVVSSSPSDSLFAAGRFQCKWLWGVRQDGPLQHTDDLPNPS